MGDACTPFPARVSPVLDTSLGGPGATSGTIIFVPSGGNQGWGCCGNCDTQFNGLGLLLHKSGYPGARAFPRHSRHKTGLLPGADHLGQGRAVALQGLQERVWGPQEPPSSTAATRKPREGCTSFLQWARALGRTQGAGAPLSVRMHLNSGSATIYKPRSKLRTCFLLSLIFNDLRCEKWEY